MRAPRQGPGRDEQLNITLGKRLHRRPRSLPGRPPAASCVSVISVPTLMTNIGSLSWRTELRSLSRGLAVRVGQPAALVFKYSVQIVLAVVTRLRSGLPDHEWCAGGSHAEPAARPTDSRGLGHGGGAAARGGACLSDPDFSVEDDPRELGQHFPSCGPCRHGGEPRRSFRTDSACRSPI